MYLLLLSGLFMGWSLGTNDSANAFGAAVATGMVRYRTATIIIAVMVLLGAAAAGERNLNAVAELSAANRVSATEEALCAAVENGSAEELRLRSAQKAALVYACAGTAVFFMSVLRLPVSANQSIAGAIIGWGLCRANYADPEVLAVNLAQLGRFAAAWLLNPLAAGTAAYVLVRFTGPFLRRAVSWHGRLLRIGYLAAGAFASFGIGANSAASVTALYYSPVSAESGSAAGLLTDGRTTAILGGAAIALGALTYSHRVMETVGGGITALRQSDGFLVILAMALAVTGMSRFLGIPVSTSEAVVGAVIGAGLTKGIQGVRFSVLRRIALAWVCSPVIAGTLGCIAANLTWNILP